MWVMMHYGTQSHIKEGDCKKHLQIWLRFDFGML